MQEQTYTLRLSRIAGEPGTYKVDTPQGSSVCSSRQRLGEISGGVSFCVEDWCPIWTLDTRGDGVVVFPRQRRGETTHPNLWPVDCPLESTGSLRHYIRNNAVSDKWRWQMVTQVCNALGYLHEAPSATAHGNLHAENVALVSRQGNCAYPLVKLIGVVPTTVAVAAAATTTLGGPTRPVYVPAAAPEGMSEQQWGKQADVYALGMLVYELFAGVPPWFEELTVPFNNKAEHDTCMKQLARRVVQKGERPQRLPGISDAAWTLIQSCCAQKRAERPRIDSIALGAWVFYENATLDERRGSSTDVFEKQTEYALGVIDMK